MGPGGVILGSGLGDVIRGPKKKGGRRGPGGVILGQGGVILGQGGVILGPGGVIRGQER